jgi:hypothetical protein
MTFVPPSLPTDDAAMPGSSCIIASGSLSEHQAMEIDFAFKELQKPRQEILENLFRTTQQELPPVLKRRDWTVSSHNSTGLLGRCAMMLQEACMNKK